MSKRKPTPTSQALDMTATRWRCVTDYGSCVGCDPSPVAAEPWGQAWNLRLPRIEDNAANKIGYVLCPHTAPITAEKIEGTFSLQATLGTQFADAKAPSDGVTPASFRFIIMQGLDSASMGNEFGRWWSVPGFYLDQAGSLTLAIPLAPDAWSSVLGQTGDQAPADFAAVLKAPQFIGLTFGAGGDYGHGIVTYGGYASLKAEGVRLL
jgi:hypothetical protein